MRGEPDQLLTASQDDSVARDLPISAYALSIANDRVLAPTLAGVGNRYVTGQY